MKKHERIFKSYRRNHQGGDYYESELSKVKRDQKKSAEISKQAEVAADRMVRGDINEDESMEKWNEALNSGKKAVGGYRTHRDRFHELQKNDDFDT